MTDTRCSYCGALNGGHTLACSALARDAEDGDAYLRRTGWSRKQVPLAEEEQRALDERRRLRGQRHGS